MQTESSSSTRPSTDPAPAQPQPETRTPEADIAATAPGSYRVIRRNGKVTPFDASKIEVALTKAFLAVEGSGAAASGRIHESVKELTEQVESALTRHLSGGGTVHIEDIQDQVELALMRSGHHKVARDYVLYREARSQERAAEAASKSKRKKAEPKAAINVTLADGSSQPLDEARLRRLIKEACEGLASGKYKVLCNCELVIEGFDLSAQVGRDCTLECCILLRPTQSLARYLQMVFRAMRKKPNPAVILDHAGCIVKHGLPCEKRDWSLEGREKGKRKANDEPALNVSQCSKCYAVFKSGVDACPMCGEPVERKERTLNEVDGELEQVDMEAVKAEQRRQRQEQGRANGLRDLIALGKRRGMKNASGWAVNVYMARQSRKPTPKDYAEAKRIEATL